jgi:hypothetical protein
MDSDPAFAAPAAERAIPKTDAEIIIETVFGAAVPSLFDRRHKPVRNGRPPSVLDECVKSPLPSSMGVPPVRNPQSTCFVFWEEPPNAELCVGDPESSRRAIPFDLAQGGLWP